MFRPGKELTDIVVGLDFRVALRQRRDQSREIHGRRRAGKIVVVVDQFL